MIRIPTLLLCLLVAGLSAHAQNSLVIPPLLTGPVFNLTVQADSTDFFPGRQTPTYGVNGNILGPTLEFNRYENVTLNVDNQMPVSTTMHWHGMAVPAKDDGGPHQIIDPGTTWSPSFTVLNTAGTFWYHPHGAHQTDMQVSKGIAGMIIVRDSVEAALDLPRTYGVDEFPLIIQSKCFDVLNQIAISTPFDTVTMVNATLDPTLDVPAQVIRLRLLNGSSERSYMIGFSNQQEFYQISTEGGLLSAPLPITRLLIAPAERYEILVNLDTMQGQSIQLMSYASEIPTGIIGAAQVGMGAAAIPGYSQNFLNGSDFNLLNLNVVAPTGNPVTTIPTSLVPQTIWNPAIADNHRSITFTPQYAGPQPMVVGPFNINGNQFDMHTVNDTVLLDDIEVWTIYNNTMVAHPFHIHDVQFYITMMGGNPPPPGLQGKKDVVLVMPMDSVSFITKFEHFSDTVPYMYHCHLLHHEDDGMMLTFIVVDPTWLGTDEITDQKINLYPNPASDQITLTFEQGMKWDELYITDLVGKKCALPVEVSANNEAVINTSLLHDGIYLLCIDTGASVLKKKFIVAGK